MANTRHLKRNSMPKSWPIKKKNITFVVKPNSGSHKLKYVTPLVIILRDVLKLALTSKEAKFIVNNKNILVNSKKILDIKYPVGLFDILEIKELSKKYMVLFDTFGKIRLIDQKEDILFLKVSGKKVISKDKFQLNFMNGFNLLVDKKVFDSIKVSDSISFDFVKNKIISVINLKENNYVYIFDGKFIGNIAKIRGFKSYNGLAEDVINIELKDENHSTAKKYCFAISTKDIDLKRFN